MFGGRFGVFWHLANVDAPALPHTATALIATPQYLLLLWRASAATRAFVAMCRFSPTGVSPTGSMHLQAIRAMCPSCGPPPPPFMEKTEEKNILELTDWGIYSIGNEMRTQGPELASPTHLSPPQSLSRIDGWGRSLWWKGGRGMDLLGNKNSTRRERLCRRNCTAYK